MKTLFFCNLMPNKRGAFEWLLAVLGSEFKRGGDSLVIVFAGEPIPEVAEQLRQQGVRWAVIDGWSDDGIREHPWAFCMPALALLRREKPDVAVMHFGNELPCLFVKWAVALCGVRNVKWIWQQDQQIRDPSRLTKHLSKLRLLAFAAFHFVAVYEGGRRSFLLRGIPGNSVDVIYNAIRDCPSSKEQGWLRAELKLPTDTVMIVTVGCLIPRKRIDFVLRSFALFLGARNREPGPDASVVLLVVGEGPELASLQECAGQLGIAARVLFLGLRNDVREIMAEADCLVHCSTAETCTYAISESMAAGIPAVVTDAGAAREQIVDGQSGYVVDCDDLDGLVNRLAALMSDPALRRRFGTAARQRWEERYRVEVSARKYHELYKRLAGVTTDPVPILR